MIGNGLAHLDAAIRLRRIALWVYSAPLLLAARGFMLFELIQ